MNLSQEIPTLILMFSGWIIHWLGDVSKARAIVRERNQRDKTDTPRPTLGSYWEADPYALALSILGLVVIYFVVPYMAESWPNLAAVIGQHGNQPMNPMTALLGGYAAPSLADLMGKRISAMVA